MKKLYSSTGKLACYFFVIIASLFAAQSYASTRYVDAATGDDSNDGTSWGTAYKTLAKALTEAGTELSVDAIYIAQGTYYPTGAPSGTDRDATFTILRGGLTIRGGYATGGGATSDPGANSTILSGDIGTADDASDNSYHVMVIAGPAADAAPLILEGLTFTKGNANGTGTPKFNGVDIHRNYGGGLYARAILNTAPGAFVIRNCQFTGNNADDGGAGIFLENGSPLVENIVSSENSGKNGGGFYALYAAPDIRNSYFTGNNMTGNGGGVLSVNCNPKITGCVITGNKAGFGGGIYNYNASPTITNCVVAGNSAGDGGSIYNTFNSNEVIANSIIYGNNQGIFHSSSTTTSSYSLIQGESSTANGNLNALATNPAFFYLKPDTDAPTTGGNYRLQDFSACLNAGNNAAIPAGVLTDVAGNPRIVRTTVDMGAYEAQPCAPAAVYVDASVSASGDGTSWGTAFKTLKEAMDLAGCIDLQTVFVARGTYYPTGDQGGTDRDATFAITRRNIKIHGGYPSGGGVRNVSANPTILSGNIGNPADATDNSYHLMTVAGAPNTTDSIRIDGFTFVEGRADGSGTNTIGGQAVARDYGAGLYIKGNGTSPGIYIVNCSFSNHFAGNGAALHEDNSYVFIQNSAFTDNQATLGGAIYSLSGELYVKLSSFLHNSASSMGGAWYAQNGAATVTGRFQGNYAGTTGGAVRVKDAFVTFHNSLFAGNLSQTGSAISTDNVTLNVKNSTIASNRSTDAAHGHAVRVTNATKSVFYNTIIRGNTGGVELINGDYRTFLYCLVQEEGTFGLGNLPGYIDPGFIDAPTPNFNTPITTGDFRVGSWGQAINKGNIGTTDMSWMNTDLYGGPRFLGGQVDMGAYEYDDTCPNTLYVDSTIAASGNGNSWGTAFKTLSEALSVASCVNVDQILIAKGTYFPTGAQSGADRDASFVIPKNKLKIIGGYPAGGGTRNRTANLTVLSGDIGAAGDHSDNSHHVVTIAGLNASADSLVIDGVSIIYGNANGSGSFIYRGQNVDRQRGGGVNLTANNSNDKILFRNVKFLGNQGGNGAAIATYQTSPALLNSLIAGNLASDRGSALYADGSAVRALHTTIASNKCGAGTADLWNGSSFNLTNSIVSGNSVDMSWDGTSSVNLSHSLVQGITGTADGNIDGSLAAEFISDPGFNTAPFITGNFGVSVESPAINAGDNAALPAYVTTDLAGNVRLQETNVDMGAFEQAYPCFYTTLYVDGSVAQSGKGGSWTKAFKTLGEALAKADECANVNQVLVAEGTYYPGGEQSSTDVDATFGIYRGGLKLLGGYPAGGGTRDPASHKTTLSGELGTIFPHDNSHHIIIIAGLAAGADSVVVDGFDIVYGYAGGFGPSIIHGQSINQQNGGGIYMTANNQSNKIAIRRNRLFGNIGAGSGLYVEQSAPVSIGNDIFANSGEAIMTVGSTVTLINNTLAGNNSGTAAVNISANSTLNVFNTIIYNNNAGIVKDGSSVANLSHSLVQGESSTANGNIDGNTDPKFVESFPYAIAPNYRGNYSITPASPAIDKGDNSLSPAYITQDLFGNARVQGGTIDMGAYEGQSLCSEPVRYVDASVSASGNGSDWSQAFKTLDEALAALSICPDINTIRVGAGTYYPGGNQSGTDRDATFAVTRGNLRIEGGYPAGGGTRDIAANTTILSGDVGTANDATDDAHHVMAIVGLGADADSVVVDGFTITKGNANGSDYFTIGSKSVGRSFGGGIYLLSNSNNGKIRISGCIFTDNKSTDGGGAIASSFTQLTTSANSFSNNSGASGAAIFNTTGAIVIANSSFNSNNGSFGGAVYNYAAASQIFGNTFDLNQASSGGALYTLQAPAAQISGNTFTNNQASVFGGAVYNSSSAVFQNNSFKSNKAVVYAGAFYNNNNVSPIITGCTFESNQGPSGGAMYNASGASPKIINSVFKGNSGEMGGAIFNQSASPSISSVAFTGNKASFFGGGIGNQSASPVIVNATFGGNSAAGGGAMFSQFSSNPQIHNSVVFGNSSGIANDGTGTQSVSFSLVQDMGGGTDGNLDGSTDPLFSNPQDPATAPSVSGDYRVGNGSPAINTGFNDLVPAYVSSDLDSIARISTLRVDMGAYEHDCPPVLAASDQEVDRYLHTGQNFIFDACTLLAGIAPAGAQPVSGTVAARGQIGANILAHGAARFVRRYYSITPEDNAENATANITLYFSSADFQHYNTQFGNSAGAVLPVNDGDNVSKLKVVQYHGQGNSDGDPASYDSHVVITPTSVTFNPNFQLWAVTFPVTGFSGFFVSGQTEDALPVRLVAFKAQKQENDVLLSWQTAEETASAYFEVQRSADARVFEKIGHVKAKGESNITEQYAFPDLNATGKGVANLYYRLKIVDRDGSFTYSNIVTVALESGTGNLAIYPNPLVRDRQLSIFVPNAQHIRVELLDTRGNMVKTIEQTVSAGKIEMQLDNVPVGTYVLRIEADGVKSVRKVVVQ